jgi:integrase
MPVYKRWKGQKIKPSHPNWDDARWTVEFRLQGKHIIQSVPTARTKAQALSAESQLREEAYNRRYGRGGKQIGFTEFVDKHYLPWAKGKKKSYYDDNNRAKVLKAFFKDDPIRDMGIFDVERLTSSLLGKKTRRGTPRKGATVNRYFSLLSKIFSRARVENLVDFNPCYGFEKETEKGRERYLTPDEQSRLKAHMVDDLEFLTKAIDISLNAGLRKSELMRLKPEHINFTGLPMFYSVDGNALEVYPGWVLVTKSKNKRPRQLPMNSIVRAALRDAVEGAEPDQAIFSYERNGVSLPTLRSGFEELCKRAKIVHGLTNSGGMIWHDLRRTFATRLRALGVHQYDIMDLLGHTIAGVTSGYARLTPDVLEKAVERLTETRGEVIRFERKVG